MTTPREPNDDDILDLEALDNATEPEPMFDDTDMVDLEWLASDELVSGRFFMCCLCGQNPVDALDGFDTCSQCLASQ